MEKGHFPPGSETPEPIQLKAQTDVIPVFPSYFSFFLRYLYVYIFCIVSFQQFYCATLCVNTVFAVAWCPPVCPSVCLSRSCILSRWLKISSIFCRPGSHIILVIWSPVPIPNSKRTPSAGCKIQKKNTRGGKILRFSTEIAVYLGNGTR